MSQLNITLFSLGKNENLQCELTLTSRDNSNVLSFESDKFLFKIILKDHVDLDDFFNFLNKKEKKVDLYSYLEIENKHYKGIRKILWRNDNIAVSQGGIRLEFEKVAQEFLLSVIKSIKKIS